VGLWSSENERKPRGWTAREDRKAGAHSYAREVKGMSKAKGGRTPSPAKTTKEDQALIKKAKQRERKLKRRKNETTTRRGWR